MIPKIIHHIWPGRDPFREKFHAWRASWMMFNPKYSMCFWDLDNMPYEKFTPGARDLLTSDLPYIVKAEIAKYQIVHALGGIYADTDMECLKSFDDLMDVKSFCGQGHEPDNVTNAIFASVAETDLLADLCTIVVQSVNNERDAWCDPKRILNTTGGMRTVGETHMSKMQIVHPTSIFFPTWCLDTKEQIKAIRLNKYNGAYAVHHWNGMSEDGWVRQ